MENSPAEDRRSNYWAMLPSAVAWQDGNGT